MPFNFDVVHRTKIVSSTNGHNAPDKNSEEYKRSLLQSVHAIPTQPLKGYKVTIEFWSSDGELTTNLVAQIHKLNGEIFTVPINLSECDSQNGLDDANRQIHTYLFWLSSWESHLESAAKAWNELEGIING